MPDSKKWDFNMRLRAIRHYRGMSQKVVAAHLHIDRSTYAYYETGKSAPSLRVLRDICLFLEVPPRFLLDLPSIPDNPDFFEFPGLSFQK